jgi:hypothetical protein
MPVVLADGQFDDWVRVKPEQASTMMTPYAGDIEAWEVGAEVGNVKNNRPELMERVAVRESSSGCPRAMASIDPRTKTISCQVPPCGGFNLWERVK